MPAPSRPDPSAPELTGALTALVLGLAALVRLHTLGFRSFWLDEAYSFQRAALPLAQTIDVSIVKNHVPTYFAFMHYFIALGDDEAMMRLPSAIFGVLTVLAATVLGRIAGGVRVGLVTGLLVALSPLQVRYAQEARMYTLFTFTATVALCGMLWLLRDPSAAALPLWRRASYRKNAQPEGRAHVAAYAAYVLGATGSLYLHNTAVFLVATCGVVALVLLAVGRGGRWKLFGNFVLANLAVLAMWSFWVTKLLGQTKKILHNFWPHFPTAREIRLNLRMMYLYDYERYVALEVLIAGLALLGLYALRKQTRLSVGLLLFAALPPALVLLVSLRTPMFMPRIMLWAPIPFFVLVACGMFTLSSRWLPLAFCAAIALGGGATLRDYYVGYTMKPPWREIASMLRDNYVPGTRVLAARSQDATSLDYYIQRKTRPIGPLAVRTISPHRLRRELRGIARVFIVDQKGGRRSTKHRAELNRMGELVYRHLFANVLVSEFRLGKTR